MHIVGIYSLDLKISTVSHFVIIRAAIPVYYVIVVKKLQPADNFTGIKSERKDTHSVNQQLCC